MRLTKKIFCMLICLLMLSSCAERETQHQSAPQSVTVQSFSVSIEPEQTTTNETLNTDKLTAPPEDTSVPSRVPPSVTQAPESVTDQHTETSATPDEDKPSTVTSSDEAGDGYEITPSDGVMYASSSVNVREEPDADSKRVGHLDKDEKVNVTGLVSNGWVRIEFEDGEYFVNGKYLQPAEPEATEPPKTEPEPTSKVPPETAPPPTETVPESSEPDDEYVTVDAEGEMVVTDDLNVREGPSADTDKVGSLRKGDTVTVTGIVSNGWVRILFEGQERYVSGDYLALPSEAPSSVPAEPTSDVIIGHNSYNALNYPVQKAVWFAYLDIDPMLKNADRASFTKSVGDAFDEVKALGCNTVYVHVRSFGDAYYYSSYYPFTAAYNDSLGSAPDFDPLEIMIQQAHDRGLSFHAWINPMRTTTKERYRQMPSGYILRQWYDSDSTNGTFMVYDSDTGYYWLSPAYSAVRQLICNGVAEIVSRYNVDAIHIDDYFYPTTSSSFDKAAFEASGASDRVEWRRSVVSSLVRDIYTTVKSCNQSVLFGVSPQGNLENNRDKLYADVQTWCSTPGYLDYVVPQIYYGFNDKLSFDSAAKQWQQLVSLSNVKLVCGIAAYKVGINSEWSTGTILKKQTDYISDLGTYNGVAYYRYGSLFGSASSSERKMQKELPELKTAIAEF